MTTSRTFWYVSGVIALALYAVSFFIGCRFGEARQNNYWHLELIERGYARHHATTGKWQWSESEVKAKERLRQHDG